MIEVQGKQQPTEILIANIESNIRNRRKERTKILQLKRRKLTFDTLLSIESKYDYLNKIEPLQNQKMEALKPKTESMFDYIKNFGFSATEKQTMQTEKKPLKIQRAWNEQVLPKQTKQMGITNNLSQTIRPSNNKQLIKGLQNPLHLQIKQERLNLRENKYQSNRLRQMNTKITNQVESMKIERLQLQRKLQSLEKQLRQREDNKKKMVIANALTQTVQPYRKTLIQQKQAAQIYQQLMKGLKNPLSEQIKQDRLNQRGKTYQLNRLRQTNTRAINQVEIMKKEKIQLQKKLQNREMMQQQNQQQVKSLEKAKLQLQIARYNQIIKKQQNQIKQMIKDPYALLDIKNNQMIEQTISKQKITQKVTQLVQNQDPTKITINFKDGVYYIGQFVGDDNIGYFTTKYITIYPQFLHLVTNFYRQLQLVKQGIRIFPGGQFAMKKDIYKGETYYGLRKIKWFRGKPFVTRQGFNLNILQMLEFMQNLQKYISK